MPSALFEELALRGTKQIIPPLIYGTAWKKERTSELVYQAISSGFKGVDTAAQPKHYREDLVGDGIRRALSEGKVKRDEIFIQTKFTPPSGQGPKNMPYDPNLTIAEQVRSSFESSFHNLRPQSDYSSSQSTILDSVVMHSPFEKIDDTLEAWRTMESYVPHRVRHLGMSNVMDVSLLKTLLENVRIEPALVQNRFFAATEFDELVRDFCVRNDIVYQAFWTLSANPKLVNHNNTKELSQKAGVTLQAAFYCLVLSNENVVILDGTTKKEHMQEDLLAIEKVRDWSKANPAACSKLQFF